MSRRRKGERPGEQTSPPEKKLPPGRFARRGPHLVDGRGMPPDMWDLLDQRLTSPEAKAELRARHPFLLGIRLLTGTLGAEEAAALALRYLRKAEAEFDDLMKRAGERPAPEKIPTNNVPLGTEGRLAMELVKFVLNGLGPEACVAAALALQAGIHLGRLHEAELQAAEIVAGDAVRRGGKDGAEVRRKERGTPPTEQRIAAWREELAKVRKPDGRLPRGAIRRIAERLAQRFGTCETAERKFYYRVVERGEL